MLTAASLCSGSPWTPRSGIQLGGFDPDPPWAPLLRKGSSEVGSEEPRSQGSGSPRVDVRNNHSSLVTVSFNLRSLVVVFSTTNVRSRVVADALLRSLLRSLLQLLLRLLQLLCLRLGSGRQRAKVLFFSLLVHPCSHFSSSASSANFWVSSAQFPSRTCSTTCLTFHKVLHRPLALRMCGPLSTRIHYAFCSNVRCLFDTWLSSCIEFTSSS